MLRTRGAAPRQLHQVATALALHHAGAVAVREGRRLTDTASVRIATPRLAITLLQPDDRDDWIAYDVRNRAHLSRWEPLRSDAELRDPQARSEQIARRRDDAANGLGYSFVARLTGGRTIAALVNLRNVVHGALQACHLGYSVDASHEGTGLAFEAVGAVVRFAFDELQLHRVMANYQPSNERSGRLLRRLGFNVEGYARDYLLIDGEWRDHVLTSRIAP